MRLSMWLAIGLSASAGCGTDSTTDGNAGDGGTSDLATPVPALCSSAPGSADTARAQARGCSVGTAAPFFLRAAPYPKMIIEIDATAGTTVHMAAIQHLQAVIADVCAKPGGVTVVLGDADIPSPGHPLSIAEVRAMEDAHRKSFAAGDTAVFYYLVVSDPSADDSKEFKVLGYAHRASSMVVFQGTIDSVSGGLGQPSSDVVTSTVVAHEFGHLLGLVNLGTRMQAAHEDPNHRAHDIDDQCLMYYANNSSAGLANLLGGGVVPDFDSECRADLAAAR